MSEASRRMYLTNQGLQLYGKIQTGTTTLQITRVVIGSGTLADDETIAELQTLKDSVDADVKITDYKIVGDGQAVIAISIDAAESDYYLREIGIIADDPDVGEILYSYCNFGEYADYIEKYNEQYSTAQEGIIYIAVGNASELNINISDTLCVTPREFRMHRESETLDHPDGSVTKEKLNDDVFEFAVDTIYDATITQTSDGNAVFNIEIPDVEGYTDLNGKIIAVYTGAYCGVWDNPQKVYVSVNGLSNRAIRRSLPTNKTADYDTKNCFTDKFISGEINKYQVLYLYFKGSIAVLLNPLSPARATKPITESTSDNSSYITPKHVTDYINTKTWNDNLSVEWNYQGTGEYGTNLPFNCTTPFRLFIPATSNNPEQTIFVAENAPITINAVRYYFETPRIGVYLKIHNGIVEVLTPDEELPEFVYLNPIDIQIKLGIPAMTLAPTDIGNLLKSTSVLSQSVVKVSSIINDYGGTRNEYAAEHIASADNPHNVTKMQIGLGNVPNVSTNDQAPTFTQASSRTNIVSGEKLTIIFGKIKKFFTDLKAVAFSGSYNDLTDKPPFANVAFTGNYNDLINKPPSVVSANKWAYFPTLTELPSALTNEWTNDGAGYNIVFSFSDDTLLLYKGRFFELSASAATDYSQNSSNAEEIWGNLAGAVLTYTLNLSNNTFTPSFVKTDCSLGEVRDTFEPNKYSVDGTRYIKLPAMYCAKGDYDATDTGNTPFKYTYLTDLYIKGGVVTVANEPKDDHNRDLIHDINKADIVLNCAWLRYPLNTDAMNDAKNNTAALMSLLKCMGSPESANLMFLHGCFYLGRMSFDQYTLQANSIQGLGGYETTIDIGDSKFGISATNIDDIQIYTHSFNAGISVKATNTRRVRITAITTSENYTLLYLNSSGHMSECYIADDHNCGEDLPTGLFNVQTNANTTISNSYFYNTRTKIGSTCRVCGNSGNNSSVTIDANTIDCIVTENVGLTVTSSSTTSIVKDNIE